ncbi:MAG TPA: acyl-ACP--UDP-N-acetylglucosamine O-acyltransferase [Fimbriiglobus sp.]|jgi:UDP-N-acetylglucosamine acyltransferase
MPRVHHSAIVSGTAQLTSDATVGPYAVIDGPVTIGPGCVIRAHAHLIGPLVLGAGNDVGTGCVLGDRPQHLAHNNEESPVLIGDGNTFREHVTVHRGMRGAGTVIGHRNYFMAGSHVGHDCTVGDHNVLANAALLGGHVVLGNRTFLSGHTAVHQHVHIGDVAMLGGMAAVSQDVPPYWLMMNGVNRVSGINRVGMRRAGLSEPDIRAVRAAFKLIYREKVPISRAVLMMEAEWGSSDAVRELAAFIRRSGRGIPGAVRYTGLASEAA